MKKSLQILAFILLSLGMTGCIIFANTSSQTQTTSQQLAKHWNLQKVYQLVGTQPYGDDRERTTGWLHLDSDGTCYESGLLGTNGKQKLHWKIMENQLTITGRNITFADGNLSGDKVTYDIVSLTEHELHLSRWDGTNSQGVKIYRHLIFTY